MRRLGVSFWPEVFSANDVIKYSVEAEKKGYDSVWIAEHYLFRDAFATLGGVASATSRIRLATGVVNPYTRHPAFLAMSIATIDELSNGRAILGIGSGVSLWIEEQMAMNMERPVSVVKESIRVIRRLLSGETVSHKGRTFTLRNMKLGFKTYQDSVPIYMAAVGPKTLQLAGEIADGVILTAGCSPKYVVDAVENIKIGAEKANKRLSQMDIVAFLISAVSEDPKAAKDMTRELIASLLTRPGRAKLMLNPEDLDEKALDLIMQDARRGNLNAAGAHVTAPMIESMSVAGAPQECRKKIEEYVRKGATLPVVMLISPKEQDGSATLNLIQQIQHG
jgi:5,10-methylenetetrahydromethanopterin reductase